MLTGFHDLTSTFARRSTKPARADGLLSIWYVTFAALTRSVLPYEQTSSGFQPICNS